MSDYTDQLWRTVADLSGLLLSEEDQETTLRRVADLAVRGIGHCDAVGITLFRDGKATTRAATGGLVYEVDNFQYDIDEGPCLQTVLDHEIMEIEDMTTETRWPRFCEHAAERGIGASLSLPLLVRGKSLGALNLYAHHAGAFTADDRKTGVMFAAQAAVALANAQTYGASVALAKQMGEALDSRAVIDQAIGVLMGENGYDQAGALEHLRGVSQTRNQKLRLVADSIVQAAVTPLAPSDAA